MSIGAKYMVIGGPVPVLALACSPGTQTIAVGTELQNHAASIVLWYGELALEEQYISHLVS
jgi:hypothetical protein